MSQDPEPVRDRRIRAERRHRAGEARLQHRRIGADADRQRRRQVLRQPHVSRCRPRTPSRSRKRTACSPPRRTASRRNSAASCPASAIMNDQHQHAWDFYDAPLVYQAFLGGQYQNNGLQVKWIAPTETFLEFGGEIGNGEAFPGTDRNKNGIGNGNAYVHLGGDVGASNSWRAGVSYLQTAARDRDYTQTDLAGNDAEASFSGRNTARDRRFRLEVGAERQCARHEFQAAGRVLLAPRARRPHLRRRRYARPTRRPATTAPTRAASMSQGVWQFMPTWRVGATLRLARSGHRRLRRERHLSRRTARSIRSARR